MFDDDKPVKNRRRNAKEWEDELLVASAFKRPPSPYIFDLPYYPYFPPTPLANQKWNVNFDLGFQ